MANIRKAKCKCWCGEDTHCWGEYKLALLSQGKVIEVPLLSNMVTAYSKLALIICLCTKSTIMKNGSYGN